MNHQVRNKFISKLYTMFADYNLIERGITLDVREPRAGVGVWGINITIGHLPEMMVRESFRTEQEAWNWIGNGRKNWRLMRDFVKRVEMMGGSDTNDMIRNAAKESERKRQQEDFEKRRKFKEELDKQAREWERMMDEMWERMGMENPHKRQRAKDGGESEHTKRKYSEHDKQQAKRRLAAIFECSEDDDLRKQFKRWAFKNHPDRNKNDATLTERLSEVNNLMDIATS